MFKLVWDLLKIKVLLRYSFVIDRGPTYTVRLNPIPGTLDRTQYLQTYKRHLAVKARARAAFIAASIPDYSIR